MRYELGDCEWSVIKPMLLNKPGGIPRMDDRLCRPDDKLQRESSDFGLRKEPWIPDRKARRSRAFGSWLA